jgi:2,3-dihydro-2,3-dihydroxybenzoate dehydrogenase
VARGRAREGAVAARPLDGVDLSGRVALVTGARRGIGLACAEALAAAGARVALADLPGTELDEPLRRLAHEGHTAHHVDVADPESVERLLSEVVAAHGRVDVAANAAAIISTVPFLELTVEEWRRTLAVNLDGTMLVGQAAARQFVRQGGGGRIIFYGSILSRIARLNNVAYCASKAAVVQAARCMALELAPHGITVNVISPGSTATEMLVGVQTRGDPALLEGVVRGNLSEWRLGIPLGRLADPADQAALAVFLASEAGRHVTGQELAVDGGQSLV